MDPHDTNDQPSSRVWKQVYSSLMYQGPDLAISKGLVQDYRVVSDTEYEFDLIPNVKFHNGEVLKASDVKFTFERMLEKKAPGAFLIGALDRIEVTGDYSFKMILKYPFGPFLTHLAHTATAIVNEKAVRAAGDNYNRNPVGTGPFKFVEWRSGDSITLERFDDYFGEKAKSEKVIFRVITENPQRAIALETGEVDVGYDIDPADFFNLATMPEIQTFQSKGLSTCYMGFNTQKAPFDNVKVRQAINYAVNTQQAINVIWQGAASVPRSPIAASVQFAREDLPGYSQDINKAKQLLAEAGFPNGFKTTMWTNDNPIRMRYAEIFQEQLRQAGIDASIEVLEWSAYLDRTSAGEHDMFILGWTAVTGDADYGMYSLFHSSQFGDAGNRTFYKNPTIDRLLDLGRTTPDPDARRAAYYEAQEIIMDEAPWVFVYVQDNLNVTRRWAHGFDPHAAGHHELVNFYNE
ncbi:glutathione ABC transporter substrate-binding protein [Breznakiella homolactica]|uniref:Glutathione ABC transporter substrate-binding protein n=2 Tax=Breznakiella homolactica TaxID=2798577 RepID=A0A7T7XRU5_9SPIR|nr:glutathione ABC transporter substrate-binding protein [Breznakiella homolactica]